MATSRFTHIIRFGFFGLLMGFILGRVGFGDYTEVHNLFTLADIRLLVVFGGAVVFSMIGFAVLARGRSLPKKHVHKGTIIGGILFGAGWAVTGACPSIALVQLGMGYVPAVFTTFGVLFGAWLYPKVHARYFRWDTGACNV